MSYKSRERARKKKAAVERAKRNADSRNHYLTIASRTTCCATCSGVLRVGAEMVYRAVPREALCKLCSENRRLRPRPSLRWERAQAS